METAVRTGRIYYRHGRTFRPVIELFNKAVMLDNQSTCTAGHPLQISARTFESPMVLVSGRAAKMSQR